MLDFTGADTKRERAKGPVRAGVTVAADNSHARPRQAQLGPDYMDDALFARVDVKERDAEVATVLPQDLDLPGGDRIGDRHGPIRSGDVVIDRGYGEIGPAHLAVCRAQALECLRRSDFVHQVQIDVEQSRLVLSGAYYMRIPDFFEECA